jgi:hypothetical protein
MYRPHLSPELLVAHEIKQHYLEDLESGAWKACPVNTVKHLYLYIKHVSEIARMSTRSLKKSYNNKY